MSNYDYNDRSDREQPAVIPAATPDESRVPTPPAEAETKLGMSMLMKIALGVLVLSSLIISISCLMKANQLNQQAAEMQKEIDEYEERIKQIKYYLNEDVDDEYIIQYARDYLDMYFPDEDVYYNDVND